LLELFEESSGIIALVRHSEGGSDTPVRIEFTAAAASWLADAHAKASEWGPVHQPMIVPPRDWSTPFNGGYITRALRGAHLVLSHSRGYLDELRTWDMPEVYSAVNAIQRTPWRINKSVLAVMQEAWGAGPRLQSLLVEADEPLPAKPAGLENHKGVTADDLPLELKEQLTVWKARAAKTHEANARRASDRSGLAKKLHVADKFKDFEAIYFPHYLDFRGRIYPFANYLNPQGDDLARGLLEFAEGRSLGPRGVYWLKVHIANLFGVDKVSFEERVKWTEENSERLLAAAADPLNFHSIWAKADSPWSALAAIFEFAGYMVQGEDYVSHLPIAMDGSCSGLQHYSAMLRDPVGGREVNLVPGDKPGDIYTQVAKRAQAVCNIPTSVEHLQA
jgi:DNA-directed RNA polymerase